MSFQTVTIVGNLGRDPESRQMPSGDTVCNFNVAVNEEYTDKSGNRQGAATWFRVSVWGNQAAACQKYLKQGRQVLVSGKMKPPNAWINREGQAQASNELRAFQVKFLGGKDDQNGSSGGSSDFDGTQGGGSSSHDRWKTPTTNTQTSQTQAAPAATAEAEDDEVPF